MNNSDTLSVNPGRTTLGALHPEFSTSFLRGTITTSHAETDCHKTLNILFGANTLHSNSRGAAMLLLRWALSALLIVSGSFILSGEILSPVSYINPLAYAVFEITAGTLLAVGVLTRIAMGAAALGFAVVATLSVIHGVFNLEALMCCLACMVFLIFGAGKFSGDFLIRKSILNQYAKRKRRIATGKMSYRAFRYANHS